VLSDLKMRPGLTRVASEVKLFDERFSSCRLTKLDKSDGRVQKSFEAIFST